VAALNKRIAAMCSQRRRGIPLQYILGTQPFGNLDIKCAPGVLIPRPETEAYTVYLAELLQKRQDLLGERDHDERLNIVDFCTGTGCIPLLLYSMLTKAFPRIHVAGVDISSTALTLAQENLKSAIVARQIPPPDDNRAISFLKGSVFDKDWISKTFSSARWDILVSNPPYVSREAWKFGRNQLSYSARRHEPRLALVPEDEVARPHGWRHEDAFYAALLDVAELLKPKLLLLEVGGEAQARRVLSLAAQHPYIANGRCELWRDNPDIEPVNLEQGAGSDMVEIIDAAGRTIKVPVRGVGHIHSILVLPKNPTSRQQCAP
jgi:HemK-like putative methylase